MVKSHPTNWKQKRKFNGKVFTEVMNAGTYIKKNFETSRNYWKKQGWKVRTVKIKNPIGDRILYRLFKRR